VGIALRLAYRDVPQRSPDEVVYAMYAEMVVNQGPGYIPRFVHSTNQNPEPGHFSWPQRAGYILILVAAMVAVGQTTVAVAAAVSLAASLLSLGLILWWGRTAFDRWTTTVALLFVATSPIDLAIARRGWQDGVLAFLILLMVFACARSWMDPARWRWPALFLGSGVVALLVKESAWPVYVAGALILAWVARRPGTGRAAVPGPARRLALAAFGLALAVAAVIAACGGVGEALATWKTAQIVNVPNEYMRLYQTGSVAYYLTGLGILQPLLFGLGIVGAGVAAARPRWIMSRPESRKSARSLIVLAWLVLGFGTLAALYPQKNLRFVSPLVVPCAFLGAWVLRSLATALAARLPEARRRWVGFALAALVLSSSFQDVMRFRTFFVRRGIPDLATPWLIEPPGTKHPEAGAP
jgi:hypothetical protein